MRYFSDMVVDFLRDNGIDTVAFNPGASFRGLHDSLVDNSREPEFNFYICCHEEISVAIAHGYYKASGRHMAVLVHANVGLLHASMAIFNAWCDRVPLLILGGNGPLDASERRPWIDWIHTSHSLATPIAPFVKWHNEPIGQWSSLEALRRAFRYMRIEATGPVFVALDAQTMEQELDERLAIDASELRPPPNLPPLGVAVVEQIALSLINADMPLLMLDYSGRNPESVAHVVSIAEMLAAIVVDQGNRYNFPNVHQANLSGVQAEDIPSPDVVFSIECQDIWGMALKIGLDFADGRVRERVKVISLDTNDLHISSWGADYERLPLPSETHLGDTVATLALLTSAISNILASEDASEKETRVLRRRAIASTHDIARKKWRTDAVNVAAISHAPGQIPLPAAVMRIGETLETKDWVLGNTGSLTIDSLIKRLWTLDKPRGYLGLSGGAGLGYGLGAAIGGAAALEDGRSVCVNIQADGDCLYTPSALWTAVDAQVPLLTIVINNRAYLNSVEHARQIACQRGRDPIRAEFGTTFVNTPVNFCTIADAFGMKTFGRVEILEELAPAVSAAFDYVANERSPALLEVLTAY
ncbi:thiamine pyrophosphate-binding protein [Komagataeibacter rhaeticus]